MSVEFVDTNILVYAYSGSSDERPAKARDLIRRLVRDGGGALSIQVLCEFYSTMTGKLGMESERAEDIIRNLSEWAVHRPSAADVAAAIRLQRRHRLSWWDSLILNSAMELRATTLWSEDFKTGQRFGSLTVRNPFA